MFELTGWKGGSYGLKISCADRDKHFPHQQKTIRLILAMPGGRTWQARANIDKPSFWNGTCREMIGQKIGEWMHAVGAAPWPKGKPPKFGAHLNDAGHLLVSCQNLREQGAVPDVQI